jgi:hypothetical protein
VPAAARADEPGVVPDAVLMGQLQQDQARGVTTHYGGHICAKCLARMPKRIAADGSSVPMMPATMVAANGGCVGCQDGAYPGGAGVAYVGGDAPGYAVLGSTDPAPVGVMRTDYQWGASPAMPGMNPAARPVMGPGAAMPGAEPPLSHTMSYPGHRRTSVLGHMLGLRRPQPWNARAIARARVEHAKLRYGSPGEMPADMPASMVYGNR